MLCIQSREKMWKEVLTCIMEDDGGVFVEVIIRKERVRM